MIKHDTSITLFNRTAAVSEQVMLFVLYFGAATNSEQMKMALEELKRQTREPPPGIEEQSYRPEILFRFNAPEEAYAQILDLSRPDRERREYPEVSYAIIGSIVTGMMGVNVVPEDNKGTDHMLARAVVVQTLPRLSEHTSTAEIHNLPVRQNVIDVRHQRNQSSSIANLSGPQFTWRASFDGSLEYLVVNGKKIRASKETTPLGDAGDLCRCFCPGQGKPLPSQGEQVWQFIPTVTVATLPFHDGFGDHSVLSGSQQCCGDVF